MTTILIVAAVLALLGAGLWVGIKLATNERLAKEIVVAEQTAETERRVADVQKEVDRTALRRVDPVDTRQRLRDGKF